MIKVSFLLYKIFQTSWAQCIEDGAREEEEIEKSYKGEEELPNVVYTFYYFSITE